MCRIESQKAMKCVPFALNVCLYVKCSSSHSQNTSTMLPVNEVQDYNY